MKNINSQQYTSSSSSTSAELGFLPSVPVGRTGNNNSGSGGGMSSTNLALHYICLPSSTALSPNAHVTLAIRSFHTNINPSTLLLKKNKDKNNKKNMMDDDVGAYSCDGNGNDNDSHYEVDDKFTSNHHDHGIQLYVSTQMLGLGSLPLHSNTVDSVGSTILTTLKKNNNNNHCQQQQQQQQQQNNSSTNNMEMVVLPTMDLNNHHYNYSLSCHFPIQQYYCTWDHNHSRNQQQQYQKQQSQYHDQSNHHRQNILTLPVRYKDLSHDACIQIYIYTSRNVKIGTVTLPMWDKQKRLKTGLQKLKVKLDVQSDIDIVNSNSDSNSNENDEKWEACQILDKLNQIEKITMSSKKDPNLITTTTTTTTTTTKQRQQTQKHPDKSSLDETCQLEELNITVNGLHNCNSIQSVPWLDSLTKQYCIDVLQEKKECNNVNILNRNNNNLLHGDNDNHVEQSKLHEDDDDNNNNYYSRSVNIADGVAYLIVELQKCDLPIVYHEQSYGLHNGNVVGNGMSGSGHNRQNTSTVSNESDFSASGSITPLDLALYHHQFVRSRYGGGEFQYQNYELVDGKVYVNGKQKEVFLNMPDLVHALDESHEHGMKQVQVLDFENINDNPVEDKYRTLQHELLRGLVDPALKPDASERSHLNAIISGTSQHLTREEKDLLWRFRFSLVDNRRALTKFLLAVEWTVESEVVQAAELLEQWRRRSPIEVSDALKLLGRNVAFQTGLVRAYAIDTLALADDSELVLYLLQLVQALKYENVTDDQNAMNNLKQFKASGTKGTNSLAGFLIERASKNIELANYLYWYLKVELDDPIYGQRYKEVFLALKNKLSGIPFEVNKKQQGQSKFMQLSGVIGSGTVKKSTAAYRTMWNILELQDQFISNVVECQLESREARGRKDVKEKVLHETLQKRGCQSISGGVAVPLPSAPHIWVTGVNADSIRVFKSALYPALIEFYVDKNASNEKVNANKSMSSTYRLMVKTGDDLRQDQLVIMMIKLMDRILKRGTLDLFLIPYPILAMSGKTGLVEFVPNSVPISQALAENNNSILEFFQKVAPSKESKYGIDPVVMQTYIRSCAGYCVITYLIGVGDRHLDNIMLQKSGHFFHIDFGFIFGRDPKPLPPAFRLTREMVDGMGGQDSQEYRQFCSLACQAYNLLRKRAGLVLNLLHLMSDAGIEDLSNNPSADAEGVIAEMEKRFRLDLTDEQAEEYFIQLIKESISAFAPRVMEIFHQLSVARR